MARQATLIYDGDCGFCRRCMGFVRRRDPKHRIRGVPSASDEARRLLAPQGLVEAAKKTMVFVHATRRGPDAFRLESAAAVRVLWRMNRAWPLVGSLLWLVPKPFRDHGYRWVARNRQKLGATEDRQ